VAARGAKSAGDLEGDLRELIGRHLGQLGQRAYGRQRELERRSRGSSRNELAVRITELMAVRASWKGSPRGQIDYPRRSPRAEACRASAGMLMPMLVLTGDGAVRRPAL
jgi:hypothetical protein